MLAIGLATASVSCTNRLEVNVPTIKITLDPTLMVSDTFVYKLGDTTSFMLSGAAGNLAFYPGIPGFDYDNRNASMLLPSAKPHLSFSSTLQWGTQQNTLKVLATDKLPSLDSAAVVNADWTDVTGKATLATNATAVSSGNIDLSDIVNGPADSLFIAFRYQGETGSTQRTWTISNYTVDNVIPEGTFNLSNLSTDASFWTKYGNVWVPASGRWIATTSQLQVIGGGATSPSNIAWIVSKPLYVGRGAPNISIPVKNINDPNLSGYNYVYTTPGIYKAVWVAFNNTIQDQKEVIKTFYIKVVAP